MRLITNLFKKSTPSVVSNEELGQAMVNYSGAVTNTFFQDNATLYVGNKTANTNSKATIKLVPSVVEAARLVG